MIALLVACSTGPSATVNHSKEASESCKIALAPSSGPLAVEAENTRLALHNGKIAAPPLIALAQIHLRQAAMTGDPGFYTLADAALSCAESVGDDSPTRKYSQAYIQLQFHEFKRAESLAKELVEQHPERWDGWMLLGDARMEMGRLDMAEDGYQEAVNRRPNLLIYDRIGNLRWLWGDQDGAIEATLEAARLATPKDPENFAWVMTRLGWLKALAQKDGRTELETALSALPDYPQAHYARGRIRLSMGDIKGAIEDFQKSGRTVEALRALAELPDSGIASADVEAAATQDPRGFALFLLCFSPTIQDPARALSLLETEKQSRQDAMTLLAWAYALLLAHPEQAETARQTARDALKSGILEPRARLIGALILQDPSLLPSEKPGLLPSEQALAQTLSPKAP